MRSKFTTCSILVRRADLLSRRALCGHHFPGNYRRFSSPRRVCGAENLSGGRSKKRYGLVIHYFCYRRSIFCMEGSFGKLGRSREFWADFLGAPKCGSGSNWCLEGSPHPPLQLEGPFPQAKALPSPPSPSLFPPPPLGSFCNAPGRGGPVWCGGRGPRVQGGGGEGRVLQRYLGLAAQIF